MIRNRRLLLSIGVIVLIVLMVWAFGLWSSYRARPSVKFSDIVIGEVAPPISCSGIVSSDYADLSSRTGGKVIWIGVDVDDNVRAGDVLVKLENYESARRDYESILKLYGQGFVSKNQLDASKAGLNDAGLASPIDGVVVKKKIMVGEVALPGVPVISVATTAVPWIDVEIDEMDIGSVRENAEARIYSDAYQDDIFFGKVAWISKAAEKKQKVSTTGVDEDKVFRSKVVFFNTGGKLKPGMTVDVDIITMKKSGIITAPRESILAKDSKNIVFVLSGGRVVERVVEIGMKDLSNVEIIKGVKPGEKVAVTLVDKLKNRMKVNAVK